MDPIEIKIWKLTYHLTQKKHLFIGAFIILIVYLYLNNKSINIINSIICCNNTWSITCTYFFFNLAYISGIKHYKKYIFPLLIIVCLTWIYQFAVLFNFQYIRVLNIGIFLIMFSYLLIFNFINIIKNKISFYRLEPWMIAIFYFSPIILTSLVLQIFYNSNVLLFSQLLFTCYIFTIAFFHSINIFISEFSRVSLIKQEMLTRNIEITKVSDEIKQGTKLKSEFIANMSHELRTPLNGILGSSSLLLDTKLNMEQKNYLDTIRMCGNNLLVIINEILDFSKIEVNKLELESIPFEVNTSIENVVDLLTPAAASQKTEIIYLIEQNVPTHILGDSTRIQQILTNLVDNSIKFTPEGFVFIKVMLESAENNEMFIKYSVEDSGVGISKQNISKLFHTFTQIDDSSTRKHGGTGLGLSIAKRLVEMMQGNISVKSEINKGSTFTFNIKIDLEKIKGINLKPKIHDDANELPLKDKSILIINETKKQYEALKYTCERWGLEVYSAETLDQVLALPLEIPPSLILINLDKPYENNLFEGISEKFLGQKINFIGIGQSRTNTQLQHEVSDKINTVVQRPIRYSLLFEALHNSIQSHLNTGVPIEKKNYAQFGETFPLRILVAEDNAVNQKLILNMLKKFGYNCDIVASGSEVLEALTRSPYDLIFMDIQMPEMDGIEATKKIISKYPKRNLRPRIIAMTAYAQGTEGQGCIDAGMEGYLTKPISRDELKDCLEFWGNQTKKLKAVG